MATTLNTYVFATQRILHDVQANYWPVSPDLTFYINLARDRVCLDTASSRVLCTITLNANQEAYTFAPILAAVQSLPVAPPARAIGAIYNINCIQSTAFQPPLARMEWTKLNAQYRSGGPLNPAAFPEAWAMYGYQGFYIADVPGSPLVAEIDCSYLPNPLVSLTDTETSLPDPLGELVPLMAARWAEYYEDAPDKAEKFMAHYEEEKKKLTEALPHFGGFNG